MSNCVINNDYDYDGDFPEFYFAKMVIAKKTHWCCECGRKISTGERYENARGKWYGGFQVFKTCANCLSIQSLFCSDPAHRELYPALIEEIYESGDGECIANNLDKLTPAARAKVCEILDEYWKEKQ